MRSIRNYWQQYLAAIGGIIALGFWYGLNPPGVFIVVIFALLLSPFIIANASKSTWEAREFDDVVNYMEQMLYSFKKVPKILTALEDAIQVFPQGKMHGLIASAIGNIQTKTVEGDIYQTAFQEMEEAYTFRRMRQIHSFLIKSEEIGGNFAAAFHMLLMDRQLWVERVYEMAQQRKNVRRNILVSLFLSAGVCKITMVMLPPDFRAWEHPISQGATVCYLISGIMIWYWGEKRLRTLEIKEKVMEEKKIQKNLDYVTEFCRKKSILQCLKKSVLLLPLLLYGTVTEHKYVLFLVLTAFLLIFFQPGMRLRLARRCILKEIEKALPIWLMDLSLLLQTENVHNALEKSLAEAPYILKEELSQMLTEIEKNPNSIEPFLNFMPKFHVPELQSALRLIYSMLSSGDREEMEMQISALVERNHQLMDKAERMENEDRLAGAGVLVLIPMVTGSVKMMTDMGLLLAALMNLTRNMV